MGRLREALVVLSCLVAVGSVAALANFVRLAVYAQERAADQPRDEETVVEAVEQLGDMDFGASKKPVLHPEPAPHEDEVSAAPPQASASREPAAVDAGTASLEVDAAVVAEAKVEPPQPAKEDRAAAEAAAAARHAEQVKKALNATYGIGAQSTGIGSGAGDTGFGIGAGDTGIGSGRGDTGTGSGTGSTGIGSGRGDTGMGLGPGDTGVGSGRGDTGFGTGRGDTGVGIGQGDTGVGIGRGDTGYGITPLQRPKRTR